MKKQEPKIHTKKCPFCEKEISSLSSIQCEYNYYSHLGSCKPKYMKKIHAEEEAKKKLENKNE